MSARITTLSATLKSLMEPDRVGKVIDVTLGYDDARVCVAHYDFWDRRSAVTPIASPVELYARRQIYQLPLNKIISLHGETRGFDRHPEDQRR